MNRTIAPDTQQISTINLPKIEAITLDNGLKVYGLPSAHEVVKIDFVFDAGKWYEKENLVADFANQLAREGTKTKTSLQINELLDFYGANLENQTFFSNAGFQLYSLSKNISQLLPLVHELFTEADFPASEVDIFKANRKEKHLQRLAKTDYVSNRIFLQNMWGKNHPYGRVTEIDDIEKIQRENLSSFFYEHYHAGNCFIILAGKYDEQTLQQLNTFFGNKNWLKERSVAPAYSREANSQLTHFI
ncbi:MAG TPA: insulinase family protein, partial [Chitinophagales bacterium]